VETVSATTELGEVFYDFDNDMVEFDVRRGDQVVQVQLVRFDRGHRPVVLDIGPVLHLDDVIGTKVAALAARAQPRDFADVAAAMDRYTPDQLLELGRRCDPALTDEEFRDAMRRLDRLDDSVFALYSLTPAQISDLRARFADWPR